MFNKIKGLWIGYYEHEIPLEKIILDAIGDLNIDFPIIKSNNFGHGERNMTIPIGVTAEIKDGKIKLVEDYIE